MRSIALTLGLAVLAASATAGAATAHVRYVTTYRPVTHYVRRTVLVRERVWRPVRHRVYYRTYGRRYYSRPYYRPYVATYPIYPAYPAYRPYPVWGWDDGYWRHRHWEHERWEHGDWG